MGTDKRERQKANRQARLAELERQQRRSSARKKYIRIGVIVVIALAAAFGLSRLIGRDSSRLDDRHRRCPSDSSATTVAQPSTVPGTAITGADARARRPTALARTGLGFESPPPTCIDQNKTYTALVETTAGNFTITLDPKPRPTRSTTSSCCRATTSTTGSRSTGSCPASSSRAAIPTGTGGGGPGYTFADELPASKESYKAGTVAMANSGPDTNGSQFFVILDPSGLDGPQYSIFGQVTDGFDTTVKALEAAGQAGQTPIINKVTITES